MNNNKYENKELCASCGGKCCKRMGCELLPEDIIKRYGEITKETILKLLNSGKYSIDWYEFYSDEHANGYYLRARHVNAPIVDPSWGGKCIMLTDTGCELTFEERPSGGRYLIPLNNKKCESNYSKKVIADRWNPYYDILSSIAVELKN